MKTVNQITRALVVLMLFSTAFVLARPVLAEENRLADEFRAEAKLAAKQLFQTAEKELKKTVEVPQVEKNVTAGRTTRKRKQPTS
ncbi:MAG: hypothetical protein AAF438_09405 [Pseudomonadota bacterium]